jgi:hypothetical protein
MNPVYNNTYSQAYSQVNPNFQNSFPANNINSQYNFNTQMNVPVNNPNLQMISSQVNSHYPNSMMMNNLTSQNFNMGATVPGAGMPILPTMPVYQNFPSGPLNCYPVINQPQIQLPQPHTNFSNTENLSNQVISNGQPQEISYFQLYKETLENGFKNLPEKFSFSLFEKLNPKFEEGLKTFKNCSHEIKLTEETLQERIKIIKDKVSKVENSILNLENKTNFIEENHLDYQNLLTNFFSLNQDIKTEKIMRERQHEEKLNKIISEVEIIKFQVHDNIFNIEQDITQNLKLEEDTWKEIRGLILERLTDVNNEINKVQLEKINSENDLDDTRYSSQCSKLKMKKEVDFKNSVKKLNDVKYLIEKIRNKASTFIKKENFSFLGRKKFNKNVKTSSLHDTTNKSTELVCNKVLEKLNQPSNTIVNNINASRKIRKSVDFSFFN